MSESVIIGVIILAVVAAFAVIIWAIVHRLKKIGKWSVERRGEINAAISIFSWILIFNLDLVLIKKYYYEISYVIVGLLIGVIIAYICYCVGKSRGASENKNVN